MSLLHENCDLLRIEVRGDHTVLLAAAEDGSGESVSAEIVLDEEIGNGDGKLL